MESHEGGKKEQERLCAQTFLDWLGSQCGTKYKLQRAEEIPDLKGRWDFVAQAPRNTQWIALEVKGLVVPQPRKLFSSWSIFCGLVTRELRKFGTIEGCFAIITDVPWIFDQTQRRELVKAFAETLSQVATDTAQGKPINIGSEIASRFPDWPTEPPNIDMALWREQHTYKIIHRPKDISIYKLDDDGCSLTVGGVVGEAFKVDQALAEAILGIFKTKTGKSAKPNEQLGEASLKGATETFLLLDSHSRWVPNIVAQVLSSLDQALLSNIDAIYLVSVHNDRVKEVWHSSVGSV